MTQYVRMSDHEAWARSAVAEAFVKCRIAVAHEPSLLARYAAVLEQLEDLAMLPLEGPGTTEERTARQAAYVQGLFKKAAEVGFPGFVARRRQTGPDPEAQAIAEKYGFSR